MTLGFRTHWQAENMPIHMATKPTKFISKILLSLYESEQITLGVLETSPLTEFVKNPKHHTIRHDAKNRWKAGNLIHFVINNRTPQRFQFSPVVEVKSVQEIFIKYEFPNNKDFKPNVFIDNQLLDIKQVYELAINDGFDSVDDFFSWFKDDFTGKIIHWTNLKY